MRRVAPRVLSLGLLLVTLAAARSAHAQDTKALLTVCNKGTVTVEAVAVFQTGLIGQLWEIDGTSVAPGKCEFIYDGKGERQRVFLGFGFKNARGQFVSGSVSAIPDFGFTRYNLTSAAIEGSTSRPMVQRLTGRTVCVHADRTLWGTTDSTFPAAENCAAFQIGGGSTRDPGTGGFYPVTLALDVRPSGQTCMFSSTAGVTTGGCAGGDHYMNVVANAATGTVTVTQGTAGNGEVPPEAARAQSEAKRVEEQLQAAFLAELAAAYDASEKRKAAAATTADPMVQADANRRAFEARQRQINYAAEHERNLRRVRDLSQFSPQWLTNTELLYVRGTVARVELSPDGRKPARLHFKESADGAFVACLSPLSFSNADVNGFVGQRLEVRGRVAQSRCGGSVADIQVTVPVMIYNLANGTPPDETILPGMNVPASVQNAAAMPPAAITPAIGPTDGVAIPVGTRLRVALGPDVDMSRKRENDTFQGTLVSPITLPDGVIQQGALVVMLCLPSASRTGGSSLTIHVNSVAVGETIWQVSSNDGATSDGAPASGTLRGNTILAFTVTASKPPVTVRR